MEQSNTNQSKPATATNVIQAWCDEQNKKPKAKVRWNPSNIRGDQYKQIIAWAVKVGQGIGYREGLQKAKEVYEKGVREGTSELSYEPVEHAEQLETSDK